MSFLLEDKGPTYRRIDRKRRLRATNIKRDDECRKAAVINRKRMCKRVVSD